jgi:hypothetical protein
MPQPTNAALREELLAMEAADLRVRAELAANGKLSDGYHPRMREVHERNAARMKEIVAESGWPGRAMVGEDGSNAAWLIVQHAIGDPQLQRSCAAQIERAIADGEAPPAQLAFLVDRIRYFEGRPQIYGTQFHWDQNGELSPWPIEDPVHVDERRTAAGLNTLEERTAEIREQAKREGETPPRDGEAFEREYQAWRKQTGWRD